MTQKRLCTCCLETKSTDEFYWQHGRPKGQCKECTKALAKKARDEKRIAAGKAPVERLVIRIDENGRECRRCRTYKTRDAYCRSDRSPDRLQSICKECASTVQRERYRSQNPVPTRLYLHDDNGRECTECDTYKPWPSFPPRKLGRNGHSSKCRECTGKRRRWVRAENLDTHRRKDREWEQATGSHYRKRYGITRGERDAMAQEQNNRCAICARESVKRLVVDHCHTCSRVRKLLCDRCNLAMHAVEEPGLLERLLAYRDAHLSQDCS